MAKNSGPAGSEHILSVLKKASHVYELGWLKNWRLSRYNERRFWVELSKTAPQSLQNRCLAFSYICDDGFESYCYEIMQYHQMSTATDFHRRMMDAATNPAHGRRRMVLASRGSFKTVIMVVAYATWLCAREYVVTGECNIRIGIQGEAKALPQDRIRACREMMESEPYRLLFGDHRPRGRGPKSKWGDDMAFSAYRKKTYVDPTFLSIALGVERTGSHPDVIITDDLQGPTTVSSNEMLDKVWRLFRLNPNLINKPSISDYSENLVLGTRWDPNDVYNRIIKANEAKTEKIRYSILIMPICKKDRTPNVPDVWDQDSINEMYDEMGAVEFSRQVLLDPTADIERIFKENGRQFWDYAKIRDIAATAWAGLGVDMAWYDRDKTKDKLDPDYTVIYTLMFTPENRIYQMEEFREQCSRSEAIDEMYRQYNKYGCVITGMQNYDQKHMWKDLEDAELERGQSLNIEWTGGSSKINKRDRIAGALERLWNSRKIYLKPGNDALAESFLEFPRPPEWDRLDAFVTGRLAGLRPQKRREVTTESLMEKHIKSIRSGINPCWPDGEPMNPRERRKPRRPHHRKQ